MSVRAVARIARLDLRGRRRLGTALFVGIVAVACAALVAGAVSRDDAGAQWDRAFERANGPHVIVTAGSAADLAPLASESGVVAVSDPVESVDGFQFVQGTVREDVVVRAADPADPPTVGAPYLVDGALAVAGDEMSLERSFALDLGLDVGDTVRLEQGATSLAFTVTGVGLDFQDCFFPNCDPGVAWVSPAGLARLGDGGRYAEVMVRLADPVAAPAFAADVAERYGDRIGGTQDWIDTREDALGLNEFFGSFMSAFGLFVLVAAGVVIAGSVTNRVVARRRDIGLLKSVGVTPRQLVAAMTAEHVVLGLAGAGLGWVLALALVPGLRIGVAEVLDPPGRVWAFGPLLVAVVAVCVVVALATAVPATRAARLTTTATLAPPSTATGRSLLARVAARSGAGPVVVHGLKDVFGRPLRSVLAALSVVLAVVALVVTLGFDRTVDRAVGDPAVLGDPWDATVVPVDGVGVETLTGALDGVPEVAAWFTELDDRLLVDGRVLLVRAVGGTAEAAGYVVREGAPLRSAGEAIAGYGLLDALGKGIGDTVEVRAGGEAFTVRVVGRYSETEDTGEVLLVRRETLLARFPDLDQGVVRVVAAAGVTPGALADRVRTVLGTRATVVARETDTGGMDAFGVAFWSVAGLVLVVAVANLGATVLLGVRERAREMGTLRTVGFTPGQLLAGTVLGAAVLVGLALVVGVPLGLWLTSGLLRGVGEDIGAGPELAAAPGAGVLAIALVAVVAVTVGVAAAVTVRMVRRSVAELVRYE